MMRIMAIGMAGALALGGAACEPADQELETEEGALEQPAAEMQPDQPAGPAGVAALRVDSLTGLGAYLTDAQGRALYLLEGEPEGSSTCREECAEEWPPFLAPQGTPSTAGDAVSADLIGTFQRQDGNTQVTYGGHALYYYHDDQGPGQTSGHDVTDEWGEWYLVTPEGEPLEGQEAGQARGDA